MALISFVDDSVYLDRLPSRRVANLLRVLFHSPEWAAAFVGLASAQMNALSLPARDRELVILLTGYLLKARYVIARHERIADVHGIFRAHRDALRGRGRAQALCGVSNERASRDPSDGLFSDREEALLQFVTTLVERTYPNEAALKRAQRFFSEAELVEIVGVHGFAATVAAVTLTFQVDVDPIADEDLLRFSEEVSGA